MFKRDITYEDFNGDKVTETFYFNLTKTEVLELEASYKGGIQAAIQKVVETRDAQGMIDNYKKIILKAYGVKSEDGKRFIKNDQVREEFTQTPAYDILFMEVATVEDAFDNFLKAVIPKDMLQELEKLEKAGNETKTLPSPPTTMSTESK